MNSILNETKSEQETSRIHEAATKGDITLLRKCIEEGSKIDAKDKNGYTPLFLASFYSGNEECIIALLDAKADINAITATKPSRTALHCAAMQGLTKIVALLLARGAKPDPKDEFGWTPLLLAVSAGHEECAKLLLKENVDVNAHQDDGTYVLHWAVNKNLPNIVSSLLDKKADPNCQHFRYKATPLIAAVSQGHEACAATLLKAKANVDAKDIKGSTALHTSLLKRQPQFVPLLLAHKANPNVLDTTNRSPLSYAVGGHVESVMALLNAKAGVKFAERPFVSHNKLTLLNLAIVSRSTKIISLLVAQGCDPNTTLLTGHTLRKEKTPIEVSDMFGLHTDIGPNMTKHLRMLAELYPSFKVLFQKDILQSLANRIEIDYLKTHNTAAGHLLQEDRKTLLESISGILEKIKKDFLNLKTHQEILKIAAENLSGYNITLNELEELIIQELELRLEMFPYLQARDPKAFWQPYIDNLGEPEKVQALLPKPQGISEIESYSQTKVDEDMQCLINMRMVWIMNHLLATMPLVNSAKKESNTNTNTNANTNNSTGVAEQNTDRSNSADSKASKENICISGPQMDIPENSKRMLIAYAILTSLASNSKGTNIAESCPNSTNDSLESSSSPQSRSMNA